MDQNVIPMDPATITAAVGAIKATVATIGEFRKLLVKGKVKPQQVNDLILQIQNSLLDAQAGLHESQDQIAALTAEISSLKRALAALQDLTDNYEFVDNMYWHKDTHEGPFCPTCVEADKRLVRLVNCSDHYECRVHNQTYLTAAQWQERLRRLSVL